jgi:hypothetical protein
MKHVPIRPARDGEEQVFVRDCGLIERDKRTPAIEMLSGFCFCVDKSPKVYIIIPTFGGHDGSKEHSYFCGDS